jgi:sugar-specific transcriptional regulator TrmB
MKILSSNFLCALALLSIKQIQSVTSKSSTNTKDLSKKLINDIKDLKLNMTSLSDDLAVLKNTTSTLSNKTELNADENIKSLAQGLDESILSLKNFHLALDKKIKEFQDNVKHPNKNKNLKKKRKEDDTAALNFYNSLSLIMLSLLVGGLVGVIFILYFSFKSDDKPEN